MTSEVDHVGEHVSSLQLKLGDIGNLEDEVEILREEIKSCNSERRFLMLELEKKDMQLRDSSLCIEKLEESISSIGLEYQCEIESMRLDQLALEQNCYEAKKSQEEIAQGNGAMSELIQDLELRVREAEECIESLENENGVLRKKLDKSEMNARVFCRKIEECFHEWFVEADPSSSEAENNKSSCGDVLGPLLSKLTGLGAPDAYLKDKMDKMSRQIHEYELLVTRLKEEVKEVRSKAKEEAEDLAQEMAELRYQMTEMLEEERKRRAYIEQVSLQRITELEAQMIKLEQERSKPSSHQEEERNGSSDQRHRKLITGVEQIHEARDNSNNICSFTA